jgi:hypothetical protein
MQRLCCWGFEGSLTHAGGAVTGSLDRTDRCQPAKRGSVPRSDLHEGAPEAQISRTIGRTFAASADPEADPRIDPPSAGRIEHRPEGEEERDSAESNPE